MSWESDLHNLIAPAKVQELRQLVEGVRRRRALLSRCFALGAGVFLVAVVVAAADKDALTKLEAGVLDALLAVGLATWAFLESKVPSLSRDEAEAAAGDRLPTGVLRKMQSDAKRGLDLERWVPFLFAVGVFLIAILRVVSEQP